MNISKRKRIVVDGDDDDAHMNNKNISGHHDIVSSSSRISSGDLIVDILLRLPLLSVHRFRSVCKQWYTLISNPDFLQTHSSSFSTNEQLLVFKSKSNVGSYVELLHVPDIQLDDVDDHDHTYQNPRLVHELSLPLNPLSYHLIDSCNGLLLLRCVVHDPINSSDTSMYEDITSKNTYYVCNPLTNHYLKLPDLIPIPNLEADEKLLVQNQIHSKHASLVFDPSLSLSYKVIRYLLRGSIDRYIDRHWQIYVYSSKTGSWRLLSATIPDAMGTVEFGLRSVLLNGVLYWSYWMLKGDDSVCLDVEKECVWFQALPWKPPQDINVIRNCLYFGECGGRLRLIERFLNSDTQPYSLNRLPSSFDVMETEPRQYQQRFNAPHYTWRVKYHVDLEWAVYVHHPFVIHCYKTENRRGTEQPEEEEVLLLTLNDRTIASFNLTSNKFKNELIPIPESICLSDFVDVFAYKPSLFPVS